MPKYWNRQTPTNRPQLPPVPTAAFRAGQDDFLNRRPCYSNSFRHPELRAEYTQGWLAEARDIPS